MAAPSDPSRQLRVGSDAELSGYAVRSHLSDGRVVAWAGPPGRVAIDAEIEREVPPALARTHGPDRFWERWTRLECVAKLADVPVVLLQRQGMGDGPGHAVGPEVEVVTLRIHPDPDTTIVVSVARM